MPSKDFRRLVRQGGRLVVALPPGWISYHGLGPGDVVEVKANGELRVRPVVGLKLKRARARLPAPGRDRRE